ncbi:MAG TPA: hypothetical protein VK009_21915 [Chloroflexota bacterium]|nr:hypothetical protein [Chloroflexota bacterium]
MIGDPRSRANRRQVETHTASTIETLVVLVKVAVALGAWLTVFLMTFLGYLTVPAVVLFGFLTVYTITDFLGKRMRKMRDTIRNGK